MATRPPTSNGALFWALRGLAVLFLITMIVLAFTDTWPYMHEVIWQQSWKPVCIQPNGQMGFC